MRERKWISKEEAKKLYPDNLTNKNFYYAGKFFEHESDFWEWVKEYNYSQINYETLNEIALNISKNIMLNIDFYKIKINYIQMKEIMEYAFIDVMGKIGELINISANHASLHIQDNSSDSD